MGGRGSSSGLSAKPKSLGRNGKARTIDEALAATNPNYDKGLEWQQNCQRCVFAYEMERRGYDVEAMPRIFDGTDMLPYTYAQDGWSHMSWRVRVLSTYPPATLCKRWTIKCTLGARAHVQ